MYVSGQPGVGKTLAVRHVVSELVESLNASEEGDQQDHLVTYRYVNCLGDASQPQQYGT